MRTYYCKKCGTANEIEETMESFSVPTAEQRTVYHRRCHQILHQSL